MNKKLTHPQIQDFISAHRLPDKFFRLINDHYSPLAEWLIKKRQPGRTFLLGINGAQGTGKTTLAAYLQLALEQGCGWRVAILSIDDFYLTKSERMQLAEEVHPLLATRGVPGTHDIQMVTDCIERLGTLESNETMALPRFDKSMDDRAKSDSWPTAGGPIDLIILEGWCVGSVPQSKEALREASNDLEAHQDSSGDWRLYVNEQLKGSYAELFAQLNALVFLQAPDFDAIYRWRVEQEEKLARISGHGAAGILNREQIIDFIQHYERLTRANIATLPETADVTFELDDSHDCVRSRYTNSARSSTSNPPTPLKKPL
ncbi:MAG: kinase [Woeseiaceae bacterium]|nr:kinase [Woeseiaceae bacterium]